VGLADLVAPVATADRDNGELGEDDGATDSSGNLLGALDAKAKVAVRVANDDKGLEAGALTGTRLHRCEINGQDAAQAATRKFR
jgi:hypothetical protein